LDDVNNVEPNYAVMKKFPLLFAGFLLLLASSCKKEETEKPKVIYKPAKAQSAVRTDTAEIEVADLPIQIAGTDMLIHPIGNYRVDGKRKSAYGYEKGSFTISNFSEFELTGYLDNIKFQSINSDTIVDLTDKQVLIQTATFLRASPDKKRQQVVVYTLADSDTNQDGKLDANDIRSLYISDISGAMLTKISPDLHELIDWNLVEPIGRLYFRTIEDTNKNGEFDRNDLLHYHYINLATDWTVRSYNPVQ